ncbi:MAG TPA: hypothetical protein VGE21_10620, partial [Flavobacteriales bacterium]
MITSTLRSAFLIRSLVLGLLLSALGMQLRAQVLFVNDNDNITYNTDTILNDLSVAGIAYDVFDIQLAGSNPTFADFEPNELVVWYASTDGVGLGFWDESVQAALSLYVDGGGSLWIIGQDLLYAVYTTPASFEEGDFAYDFMGLGSYDVQSYADDGGLGVPMMQLDPAFTGEFPATLAWQFSTLWYADGCSLREEARAIYTMGPEEYPLAGTISMMDHAVGDARVMSTLFDPALIDSFGARVEFLAQSVGSLMNSPTGIHEVGAPSLRFSSNPATDRVEVLCTSGVLALEVRSIDGALV